MKIKAQDFLCLALDGLDSFDEVKEIVFHFKDLISYFKVGLESFSKYHLKIIDLLYSQNAKIFLDLKIHDIPQTIENTSKYLSSLPIDLFTIHLSGGRQMIRSALKGRLDSHSSSPKIVGITLLTSIDQFELNEEIGSNKTIENFINQKLLMAMEERIDGVVCSASDLLFIDDKIKKNLFLVTPGILFEDQIKSQNSFGGHKRYLDPLNAIKHGSDLLVIGRSLLNKYDLNQSKDRCQKVLTEISSLL